MSERTRERGTWWSRRLERLRRGAENALELVREGRLGAPYRAPFTVVWEDLHVRLRRYAPAAQPGAGEATPVPVRPLLLVPPLMVTSEIYDISPELSAVAFLSARGADVYVCDFGPPESAPGGLDRTLDDHVLAVSRCVDEVQRLTGRDPHLVGYSQGGMFCYQAAAYRKGQGLASVVAFGAPVDIHRNAPLKLHDAVAGQLIGALRRAIGGPLAGMRALPGTLSSRGFKLLAPVREVKHLVQMVGLLPDRERWLAAEPKRRFLGGEGFIAWPGPALRTFIDQFVVENRMLQGGFVIAGKTAALADITCPILYVVGEQDDLAQPEAVKAIAKAAVGAETYPLHVDAGHFGLVVGSLAMTQSWPTVLAWAAWRDGVGPEPELLVRAAERAVSEDADAPAAPADAGLQERALALAERVWARLGVIGVEVADVIDTLRWQVPRMARLEGLGDASRVSFGRTLAERARAAPEHTFFVWQERAFTYAEADARVDAVAGALLAAGVQRGQRVAVWAERHPDVLSLVGATSRIGAVCAPLPPELEPGALGAALTAVGAHVLVVDPAHAERAQATGRRVLVLGLARAGALPAGVVDLDAAIVSGAGAVALHGVPERDAGRGGELALVLVAAGAAGVQVQEVTHRRWFAAALTAAITLRITPGDTVYAPVALHGPAGLFVAAGAALVGGARLALAAADGPEPFWREVRNVGATVVVHEGELVARLIAAPDPSAADTLHPVRVVAGVEALAPAIEAGLLARFAAAPGQLAVAVVPV